MRSNAWVRRGDLLLFHRCCFWNLINGGSKGRFLILMVNESGIFSPIFWHTKKFQRLARSMLVAEVLVLADGIDKTMSTMLNELITGLITSTCNIMSDWLTNLCLLQSNQLKQVVEKGLPMELSATRSALFSCIVHEIDWCEPQNQLATKECSR